MTTQRFADAGTTPVHLTNLQNIDLQTARLIGAGAASQVGGNAKQAEAVGWILGRLVEQVTCDRTDGRADLGSVTVTIIGGRVVVYAGQCWSVTARHKPGRVYVTYGLDLITVGKRGACRTGSKPRQTDRWQVSHAALDYVGRNMGPRNEVAAAAQRTAGGAQ